MSVLKEDTDLTIPKSRKKLLKICSLIFTGHITEKKTFRTVFRSPAILLPFLNAVFDSDFSKVDKLTAVTVPSEENSEEPYNTAFDLLARDAEGNAYAITMDKACKSYDLVRIQHIMAKTFVNMVDEKVKTLRAEARKAAEAEAKKASAEVVTPGYQDVFNRPEDVPKVIVISIVERGMPKKQFSSQFAAGQYTLFSSAGLDSNTSIVFVDLKRFASTEKLRNPEKPLDRWCQFLWEAKDGQIGKDWSERFGNVPGIGEAAEMIRKMSNSRDDRS